MTFLLVVHKVPYLSVGVVVQRAESREGFRHTLRAQGLLFTSGEQP